MFSSQYALFTPRIAHGDSVAETETRRCHFNVLRELTCHYRVATLVVDHPYRKVKNRVHTVVAPLPLKCYELLALLADAKEPVHQEDIPKPLDGDPLTVCRVDGYVESYNANIEQRFPGASLRTRKRAVAVITTMRHAAGSGPSF